MVSALPWCLCVPNSVRISRIFLQILSGNHLSYAIGLNELCALENKVKLTWFEIGLRLALVVLCTKFGEDTSNVSLDIERNVSSDIERKPSFICRRIK